MKTAAQEVHFFVVVTTSLAGGSFFLSGGMTIRFTYAEKWADMWFRKLRPMEKLLFLYVCDNCNMAGIWEVDLEQAAFSIGASLVDIKGAWKGLQRGFEKLNETHVWLKNFLKHQRNLPLNPRNPAHIGIIKILILYKDLSDNILRLVGEAASKGLQSPPSNSNSISNGKGVGKSKGEAGQISVAALNLKDSDLTKLEQLWNKTALKKINGSETLCLKREVLAILENVELSVGFDDICQAVRNYGLARKVPNTRAKNWNCLNFIKRLQTHETYRPGYFDIDHFGHEAKGVTPESIVEMLKENRK